MLGLLVFFPKKHSKQLSFIAVLVRLILLTSALDVRCIRFCAE